MLPRFRLFEELASSSFSNPGLQKIQKRKSKMTSARECKTQNHADLVRGGENKKRKKKENKRKKKLNLLGDETAKRITGRDVIVTEVVVVVQMQFRIVIGFTLQTGVR